MSARQELDSYLKQMDETDGQTYSQDFRDGFRHALVMLDAFAEPVVPGHVKPATREAAREALRLHAAVRASSDPFVAISTALDAQRPDLAGTELQMWRRVTKVCEESGEVWRALSGYVAENPRKGRTHTLDDLLGELLDTASAALCAWAHAATSTTQSLLCWRTSKAPPLVSPTRSPPTRTGACNELPDHVRVPVPEQRVWVSVVGEAATGPPEEGDDAVSTASTVRTVRCGRIDAHPPHHWIRPSLFGKRAARYWCAGPGAVEGGSR